MAPALRPGPPGTKIVELEDEAVMRRALAIRELRSEITAMTIKAFEPLRTPKDEKKRRWLDAQLAIHDAFRQAVVEMFGEEVAARWWPR